MKNKAYIENYLDGIKQISAEICREDIDRVIESLFEAWAAEKRIFIFGNGGLGQRHICRGPNKCTSFEEK